MPIEITKGIYILNIPLEGNPLKYLNSYYIASRSGSLLIDTGFNTESCRSALASELSLIGADMTKTDILLTHFHSDHSGLSSDIIRPGRRIFVSGRDAGMLGTYGQEKCWLIRKQSFSANGFPSDVQERVWNKNPARVMAPSPYKNYTYIEEGDELTYGGYTLRCVSTAGHTPGHICMYCAEKKLAFLGDHVLFDISPNIVQWDELPDALGVYLANLDKVAQLDIEIPLTGHRKNDGDVAQRVAQLHEHHARRLSEILATLEQGEMTAYDIAQYVTWNIRCRNWDDFPDTQKWFAVGEVMAHLEHLYVNGQTDRRTADGLIYYSKK